ncbi:MAG: GMC family oxidoreductase [Elusimicrobia bacterium]|nr:GMC family oxidoreductase [Elusimicrobiota bacterium]
MNYVVGSGPSGATAAKALLDRGLPVTMLDAGAELDGERAGVVAALAAREPEDWDPARVERIRNPLDAPMPKRSFGSAFPYALGAASGLEEHGTKCLVSRAKGGLSNVWGAAVLPAPDADFESWPVSAAEMIPHYAAAAGLLRIAASRGELEDLFPFHVPPRPAAEPSPQARVLLGRLRGGAEPLARAGLRFGASRLAVRTEDGPDGKACRRAGLCLSGCPYGAIWNSAQEIERLRLRPGFRYEGGVRVLRVESSARGATVIARRVSNGEGVRFEGKRVFLACGPLATARVVLASLDLGGRELTMRFQPYFLLPAVMAENASGTEGGRALTLAQIFLELSDPALSRRLVHMQIYTRNEFTADRLRRAARWAGPLAATVARAFSGRLLAIQGYLHSDEGEGVRLTARREGEECRLVLRARPEKNLRRRIQAIAARLRSLRRDLGFTALTPMLSVGNPGEGNHVGGIFPMRRSPEAFETDQSGRLPGMERVHLVDSSVLPSLSAATLTYTVMANAHRIASLAAQEGH